MHCSGGSREALWGIEAAGRHTTLAAVACKRKCEPHMWQWCYLCFWHLPVGLLQIGSMVIFVTPLCAHVKY